MSIYRPTRLYIKKHIITGLQYFGKSIQDDINTYKGSGTYWRSHLKKHGRKDVINLWVSDWFYDEKEIKEFALAFSEIFDIVNSDKWANLKEENGLEGGDCGNTKGRIKRIETMNDPKWLATTGKIAAEKRSKTKNDPEWKATTGKKTTAKIKQIRSDPVWKATVGKARSEKISNLLNSEEWKSGKGLQAAEKRNKTMNDSKWREKNQKECEVCKRLVATHIYSQFHGSKCNYKEAEYYRNQFRVANVNRKEFFEMYPDIDPRILYKYLRGL